MSKDLQIIKKLFNRFQEFYYEFKDNEVTRLDLHNKGVETKDLELIGELTSLEVLELDSNNITTIQGLDKLTKLRVLALKSNKITTIQGLEKLAKLEVLELSYNYITKIKGLDKLIKDNLINLVRLDLTKNNIPEKEIEQFKINHPEIKVYV